MVGGLFKHHPINCIPKAEWARCPLMRLDLYWIIHTKYWIYTILQTMFFFKKNRDFATEWWHFYMFLAAFYCKKQRFCNRMMNFLYVFGGILCGLHKVHKTPRYTEYFENMGLKCLTCCELDFLAGGILCVALNLILPSQNFLRTIHYKKVQLE